MTIKWEIYTPGDILRRFWWTAMPWDLHTFVGIFAVAALEAQLYYIV